MCAAISYFGVGKNRPHFAYGLLRYQTSALIIVPSSTFHIFPKPSRHILSQSFGSEVAWPDVPRFGFGNN
jgi:hypothetical protein